MAARKSRSQMATMADLENRFAQEAQAQYEGEPVGASNYLNIKNNEFKFQNELIGETMMVIILDYCWEYTHYDHKYNKDNPIPPGCFAVGREREQMEPHGDSSNLQNEGPCSECWADAFGSSETGEGKACKNSRRIALLGIIQDEEGNPSGIAFEEVMFLRVPPTSLSNFSGYIKRSNKITGRPAYAYVTELGFDDESDYEKLTFKLISKIDDFEAINKIDEIRMNIEDELLAKIDTSNYISPEEVRNSNRRTTKKKVAKKKVAKKKVVARRGRSKMS